MAEPEHLRQKHVRLWVRENVPTPRVFVAFDRSKKQSQWQHMREKARGLRKGTADTCLQVLGLPAMWVEMKAPGKKPDDDQRQFGADVVEAGALWDWTDSVVGYATIIRGWGVKLGPLAMLSAEDHDRQIAAMEIRAEESKTGKPSPKRVSKPRAPRPSPRAVARGNAASLLGSR